MTTFTINTKEWNFFPSYCRTISIDMENTVTNEGFRLKSMNEVVDYLADFCFAYDYVCYESVRDAVYECATELGNIYADVYELEKDIRDNFI